MFHFGRPTLPRYRLIGRRLSWVLIGLLLGGCAKTLKVVHGGPALPGEEVEVAKIDPGKYGGTFVLVSPTEPKTFNPNVPNDVSSNLAQLYILDSIVRYSPMTSDVTPGLAKSWEMGADKKTYTFHLRHGLRWSDGEPFSADDVIFTMDCIFAEVTDPKTGEKKLKYPNRGADDFTFGGKRMTYRKIDDDTVELYTPEVFSTFLVNLNEILVLPKHKLQKSFDDGTFLKMWSSQTAIDHPEEIVGMGPYVILKYQPGERIIYGPNPYFWRVDPKGQRLPYIDYLVDQFVATPDSALLAFATAQADYTSLIPPTDVPWVTKNAKLYDYTVYNCGVDPGSRFFWFNLKPGANKEGKSYVEPYKLAWFTNKLFRQAVMYGFDRIGVAKGIYFGRAEPEESIINQGNPLWYNPDVHHYPYDPAKARELLTQAGFHWDASGQLNDSANHPVEFELSSISGQAVDTTTIFKKNMQDLGITVRINPLDFGAVLKKVDSTFDYEMCMIGWASPSGAVDPSGNKALFMSDSEDHLFNPSEDKPATDWEKRVDDLITLQEQSFDPVVRKNAFNEIQSIYSEQLPMLYLVTPYVFQGLQNKWRNVKVPPTGYFNWNMEEYWLAQTPADRQPPENVSGVKTEQ